MQNLEKRKAVTSKSNPEDKRGKLFVLTPIGEELIDQIDKIASPLFEEFAARLNKPDQALLTEMFESIATFLGQPKTPVRGEESTLRMEQRRLSRALGVLSSSIFDSNLTSSQWHVLNEIVARAFPPNAKELSHLFGIPPNSLTVILSALEDQGLIKRVQSIQDSRRVEINITAYGREFFSSVEERAIKTLSQALKNYDQKTVSQMEQILSKYVGEGEAVDLVFNALPHDLSIIEIRGKKDLIAARSFAINQLVRLELTDIAPERIVSSHSLVYGLVKRGTGVDNLLALCEVMIEGQEGSLSLFLWRSGVERNYLYSFLLRIRDTVNVSEGIDKFRVIFPAAQEIFERGHDQQKVAVGN